MKIKRVYRLARRWKRKLQRGLWLLWMPLALACDLVSLPFLCLPLPDSSVRVISFLLVHAIIFAAASKYWEGAAAAASDIVCSLFSSLLAPEGEPAIAYMKIELRSSLPTCLANLLRLSFLLLIDLIILVCVCARFTLACVTACPKLCTVSLIIAYIVLGSA